MYILVAYLIIYLHTQVFYKHATHFMNYLLLCYSLYELLLICKPLYKSLLLRKQLNDNCFYANTFMDHTETYALFTLLRGQPKTLNPTMPKLMNRQFLLGSANAINTSIGVDTPVRFDRIGNRERITCRNTSVNGQTLARALFNVLLEHAHCQASVA